MNYTKLQEAIERIVNLSHNKSLIEETEWQAALKTCLKDFHDIYCKSYAPGENFVEGIEPQRLLTNIHEIQNAKKEMDQDITIAIQTIVDRFKERTNLYIQDIKFEMHIRNNSRHGFSSILDKIVTGVKTKVEL